MEYKRWEVWTALRDSGLMSKAVSRKIDERVSQQKFYLFESFSDRHRTLYTAQYVRGWMWVYDQYRKLREAGDSFQETTHRNLQSLGERYHLSGRERTISNPQDYAWIEVMGVRLSSIVAMSSRLDMFEFADGSEFHEVRTIPLDTFSSQQAELL